MKKFAAFITLAIVVVGYAICSEAQEHFKKLSGAEIRASNESFGAAYYFLFFLLVMPLVGIFEKTRPLPANISKPVLLSRGKT